MKWGKFGGFTTLAVVTASIKILDTKLDSIITLLLNNIYREKANRLPNNRSCQKTLDYIIEKAPDSRRIIRITQVFLSYKTWYITADGADALAKKIAALSESGDHQAIELLAKAIKKPNEDAAYTLLQRVAEKLSYDARVKFIEAALIENSTYSSLPCVRLIAYGALSNLADTDQEIPDALIQALSKNISSEICPRTLKEIRWILNALLSKKKIPEEKIKEIFIVLIDEIKKVPNPSMLKEELNAILENVAKKLSHEEKIKFAQDILLNHSANPPPMSSYVIVYKMLDDIATKDGTVPEPLIEALVNRLQHGNDPDEIPELPHTLGVLASKKQISEQEMSRAMGAIVNIPEKNISNNTLCKCNDTLTIMINALSDEKKLEYAIKLSKHKSFLRFPALCGWNILNDMANEGRIAPEKMTELVDFLFKKIDIKNCDLFIIISYSTEHRRLLTNLLEKLPHQAQLGYVVDILTQDGANVCMVDSVLSLFCTVITNITADSVIEKDNLNTLVEMLRKKIRDDEKTGRSDACNALIALVKAGKIPDERIIPIVDMMRTNIRYIRYSEYDGYTGEYSGPSYTDPDESRVFYKALEFMLLKLGHAPLSPNSIDALSRGIDALLENTEEIHEEDSLLKTLIILSVKNPRIYYDILKQKKLPDGWLETISLAVSLSMPIVPKIPDIDIFIKPGSVAQHNLREMTGILNKQIAAYYQAREDQDENTASPKPPVLAGSAASSGPAVTVVTSAATSSADIAEAQTSTQIQKETIITFIHALYYKYEVTATSASNTSRFQFADSGNAERVIKPETDASKAFFEYLASPEARKTREYFSVILNIPAIAAETNIERLKIELKTAAGIEPLISTTERPQRDPGVANVVTGRTKTAAVRNLHAAGHLQGDDSDNDSDNDREAISSATASA